MPGSVLSTNLAMAINAPVFPADTTELASPSQTALIARRMLDSRADLAQSDRRFVFAADNLRRVPELGDRSELRMLFDERFYSRLIAEH